MTTILVQVAIHLALGLTADNQVCTHNWDCLSGQCDNPKTNTADGGWLLTCCEPLGAPQACTIDGGNCCTYGSAYVTCDYVPGLPLVTGCGIPGSGLFDAGPNPFQCYSDTDCTLQTVGDPFTSTECLGTFYYDAGPGVMASPGQWWLPFDAGPWPRLVSSACTNCFEPGQTETGYDPSPCAACCTNNCQGVEGVSGGLTCCSAVGQVCRTDSDCCTTDAGAATESCFLTESCQVDGGEFCGPTGKLGTCAYINGQACTTNEQCRSGTCGDAGLAHFICINLC